MTRSIGPCRAQRQDGLSWPPCRLIWPAFATSLLICLCMSQQQQQQHGQQHFKATLMTLQMLLAKHEMTLHRRGRLDFSAGFSTSIVIGAD